MFQNETRNEAAARKCKKTGSGPQLAMRSPCDTSVTTGRSNSTPSPSAATTANGEFGVTHGPTLISRHLVACLLQTADSRKLAPINAAIGIRGGYEGKDSWLPRDWTNIPPCLSMRGTDWAAPTGLPDPGRTSGGADSSGAGNQKGRAREWGTALGDCLERLEDEPGSQLEIAGRLADYLVLAEGRTGDGAVDFLEGSVIESVVHLGTNLE